MSGIQLIILSLLGEQLIVVAALDDLTLLQYQNSLCIPDGGKAVGDDKDRAARHQTVHTLFDQFFRAGINGTGGFIQDQHRRIGHRGAGNGQELTLALGKASAVVRDPCVIPIGQMADKGIGVGKLCRGADFLVGGIQLTVADIIRNGSGEKMGPAERYRGNGADCPC